MIDSVTILRRWLLGLFKENRLLINSLIKASAAQHTEPKFILFFFEGAGEKATMLDFPSSNKLKFGSVLAWSLSVSLTSFFGCQYCNLGVVSKIKFWILFGAGACLWLLCMYAPCTLGWMETTGGVSVCESDLYSDLSLLGTVIIFAWLDVFSIKFCAYRSCVVRFQVQLWLEALPCSPPLCPCGFSPRTLVSSCRPKFLTVKLKPEVWLMMKICVRLPGTAGLPLVSHHGEHLHRQISTSERGSETARYGLVASCLEWNRLNWPGRALMRRDSLHFLSQNNSLCYDARLELAVWTKTSVTTSNPFKIK